MVQLSSQATGRGFELVFDKTRGDLDLEDFSEREGIFFSGASADAVVKTTTDVKLKIRAYINAHFKGSQFTGNNNRRVANASAQDKFYDERTTKGQYAGLVYSKFGKRDGAKGFVDYLLLHIYGGAVKAAGGGWLRINASGRKTFGTSGQTGFYSLSQSDIFFTKSADGRKLFLLRRYKRGSFTAKKEGKTELIATLLKTLIFPARLTGIDEIFRSSRDLLTKNFLDELERRRSAG